MRQHRTILPLVVGLGFCAGVAPRATAQDTSARPERPPITFQKLDVSNEDAQKAGGSTPRSEPLTAALQAFAPERYCSAGWCWVTPAIPGNTLTGIAGTAEDDIWISAWTDTVLRWDGSALRAIATGLRSVHALWIPAPGELWAAGAEGFARWSGSSFTRFEPPGLRSYRGGAIWGADADTVYVSDELGNLALWKHGSWRAVPDVNGTNISGTGPNDVWAGGLYGLWHFDGKFWTRVTTAYVRAIHSFDERNTWVVVSVPGGEEARRYDGETSTLVRSMTVSPGSSTKSIGGSGPDDVWIVGSDRYEGFAFHHDGAAWEDTSPVPVALEHVNVIQGSTYAVGEAGRIYRLGATPFASWEPLNKPAFPPLKSVWGRAPNDVWAVGMRGTIVHYDGERLTLHGGGTTEMLTDVGGTTTGEVWAVGDSGTILHMSDGPWQPVESGTAAPLLAVFASAQDEVWIGGRGILLRASSRGVEKFPFPGPAGAQILDLHGTGKDDVWAALTDGISHYDGRAWSTPVQARGVKRVWSIGPNDAWATTGWYYRGAMDYWQWDGTTWQPRTLAPSVRTWMFPFHTDYEIGSANSFAFGPDDVWSVTHQGFLLRQRTDPVDRQSSRPQ